LAKFTRDGTFFYDANGQLLASYRKDGATIGNIKITGHSIESINFEEGVKGFRIKDTGEVELENAKVRGEINAESGKIGGWNIESDKIISTNEQAELNSDGSIKLKNNVSYQLSFRPDGIFLKAKNFTVDHTPQSSDDYISDVVIKKLDDTVIPDTKYYFESRTGKIVKKSVYANDETFPDNVKIDYTLNKYEGATPNFIQYNYTDEEHTFVLSEFNTAIIDMDGKVDQKYIRDLKVGTLEVGKLVIGTENIKSNAISISSSTVSEEETNVTAASAGTWYDIEGMSLTAPSSGLALIIFCGACDGGTYYWRLSIHCSNPDSRSVWIEIQDATPFSVSFIQNVIAGATIKAQAWSTYGTDQSTSFPSCALNMIIFKK